MKLTIARHFAAMLCAASALAGCNKAPAGPEGVDFPTLAAERVMYGADFWSDQDSKRARMHADTALFFNRSDSTVVQLRGMHVQMYDEAGRKSASVTSKKGSINTQTKLMIALGNVVLITQEGKKVLTEELHYDPNSSQVWSDTHTIVINADGSRQTMNSFRTDDKFRNLSAKGARGATGIVF